MRIEIKKFGDILISRPAGREAHLAMSAYLLKGLPETTPIELDFAEVKVLTPSWADEVIPRVLERFPNTTLTHTENPTVALTLKTLREYSDLKI